MKKEKVGGGILALIFLGLVTILSIEKIIPSQPDRTVFSGKAQSQWVFSRKDGKLIYKKTPAGDRIMDFSHAGYMGGGIKLPEIPTKRFVEPLPELRDHSKLIQQAINEVALLPLKNGFRGAVELAPGTFICSETIKILASGIVLRGSGSGKEGTTIKMVGDGHTAIEIGWKNKDEKSANEAQETGNFVETEITQLYVSSGAKKFRVADPSGFRPGDKIEISKPITKAWIKFMEMHNLVRDGKQQTWIRENSNLEIISKIIDIKGDTLFIDVPLSDSFNAKYLDPPGATIRKIRNSRRLQQVGVEHLHVQCPPLETSYGNAPYSGVRVSGDDSWVKDVYFEETMNTTVLNGDRITMQEVVVKHTYPNLGASKPTDFSIEGSQNLLDRCKITGGNTYFVWTGSLEPGPNVLLNCTFRGHGSRIQPHQRWSTGMLIDNCTVPDGGIDLMNRGVAGSGHGWTMGWGIVWNSIAKTYIIQNPPGAVNWAIGSIGERVKTARLFDTEPILPEGVFDSHGIPVAPQSLYLAQLEQRLGVQAIKNIGYSVNDKSMFTNKSVPPLPPLKTEKDSILGVNLALHRPINSSNVKGKNPQYGVENVVDGDDKSYWTVDESVMEASFTVDTEGPLNINAVKIGEAIGKKGHVREYKIEGQVNSDWKLLSKGTTIGNHKVHKFPETTVWKIRVILKSNAPMAINRFGIYLED